MPDVDFEELDSSATSSATAGTGKTSDETTTADKPGEGAAAATATGTGEAKTGADQGIQITNEADLAALRQLADMGITPTNATEFLQAKQALDQLNTALLTDPDTVLAQLEAANSDAYFQLLDKAANRFLKHFPPDENAAGGGTGSAPKPDPRIESLEGEVRQLRQERQSEKSQQQAAQVKATYDKRLDDLIGDAAKKANLNERDKDFLRLKTNELVARDDAARRRISQGIYVDLPAHFASALRTVAAETKAASTTDAGKRATVAAAAHTEVTSGAENTGGTSSAHGADEWDVAAEAFAADLVRQK